MNKYLSLLCLPAMLIFMFASCSDDDGDGAGGGEGGGHEVEVVYENLVGEWICYYQHWEEGEDHQSESYYNDDNLAITFNEDRSGYLKSESAYDELLETGRSEYFTYTLSGNIINRNQDDVPWIIMSLKENELTLKRKDGDYIITAKFTRRKSLAGKVSHLSFLTDYDDSYDYHSYWFFYDFKGELNAIGFGLGAFDEDDNLTFEPQQNGVRYINWYNKGDRLKLIDHKDDGRYAEVFFNNTSIARAEYDNNGYLVEISNNYAKGTFTYSGGNMSSFNMSDTELKYEYSKEKNDESIDLNYFIDYFLPSNGTEYGCVNYLELGLAGKRSANLISRINTPEFVDYYFTYSYEKDSDGRISSITRNCINRYDNNLLNTCTISVEYYDE